MRLAEALEALGSGDLHTRLQAARTLVQVAEVKHLQRLQEALSTENVVWVRTALRQAIARLRMSTALEISAPETEMRDVVSPEVFDQIRAISVNETTRRIVHEIAPILGLVRLYAREEIPDFESSRTHRQLERLHELLRALDRLSRAATAPELSEFDLSEVARQVAEVAGGKERGGVELGGPTPFVVLGDRTLVEIALVNGVRNGLEAVQELFKGKELRELPPIVITWGSTDREIWVAVLDRGPGPPVASERAFEIGSTTKEGHLGFGLATARQAVECMSGTVTLTMRAESGGARFEIRWPKSHVTQE